MGIGCWTVRILVGLLRTGNFSIAWRRLADGLEGLSGELADVGVGVVLGETEFRGCGNSVALLQEESAQAEVRLAEVGVEAEGVFVVRDRTGLVAGGSEETTEEFVRDGLLGVELERLFEESLGGGDTVQTKQGDGVGEVVDGGLGGAFEVPGGGFQVVLGGTEVRHLAVGEE